MKAQERELLDAARAAVNIERGGKLITADITKDPEKLKRLIRAAVALDANGGYWAER